MIDLMRPKNFSVKLKTRIEENNAILESLGGTKISFKEVEKAYLEAGRKLAPYIANTVVWLHEQLEKKKRILFEGAQGTFLDIDFGTYPFVTSSNTTAGGSCTGSGIPPHRMDRVVGVMKAYTTRVGEGPLPTEATEISDMLHAMGREFGATTGRARRCGWFDAVATPLRPRPSTASTNSPSPISTASTRSRKSRFASPTNAAASASPTRPTTPRNSSTAAPSTKSSPAGKKTPAPSATSRNCPKTRRPISKPWPT